LKLKLAQALTFLSCCWLIYYNVDSLLWKSVFGVISLAIIPGFTYFVMTSLRQARADYISPDERVGIGIRRLVKIYDEPKRFVREWQKGERLDRLLGRAKHTMGWRELEPFTWKLPLMGFLVYFVYFYIGGNLWLFILSHAVYFLLLYLWSSVVQHLDSWSERSGKAIYAREGRAFQRLILWGFPAFSLWLFHGREYRVGMLLFIALVWYSALVIFTTSKRLHSTGINIMRLTGRFAGLRRHFYRFVMVIPILGRKKVPFNALDGVTIDISSGMFGLLGPNGAGKTTLMRVLCGILGQSLGTVRVNDIDLAEKREELQGLIGYMPQEFGTYENMTAYEFLDYIAILKDIYDCEERARIVEYVLGSVHLTEQRDRRIGSFSGGMKQRIGIAMTLLHLPRILVVDEPTAGLDPRERIRFRNLLVELSRERIVIFSTHIIEDVSSSCNKVAVLEKGLLYYLGNPQNMTDEAQGRVWQFYVSQEEFNKVSRELRIIHHMRVGDSIRVRCLSAEEPWPGAETVVPTLEDAYLWLLGGKTAVKPRSDRTERIE